MKQRVQNNAKTMPKSPHPAQHEEERRLRVVPERRHAEERGSRPDADLSDCTGRQVTQAAAAHRDIPGQGPRAGGAVPEALTWGPCTHGPGRTSKAGVSHLQWDFLVARQIRSSTRLAQLARWACKPADCPGVSNERAAYDAHPLSHGSHDLAPGKRAAGERKDGRGTWRSPQ